jgi:shikimate dehydrogenase
MSDRRVRREITGKTVVCGVIGNPIEHTLSPAMQNAAFDELGLDWVYVPFRVSNQELGEAIRGMRALNIRGLNVTIPHKVAVMQYLDEVDEMAANIGAVNTVVNQDGCLKGYNTDGLGFLRALTAEGVNPKGKKIVILGAGGAARAISFILADKGAELTIVNRHVEGAKNLAGRIEALFRKSVEPLELNEANLEGALKNAQVLVNTTSVGMSPNKEATIVPCEILKADLTVFDVIYSPLKTRLLSEAAATGAKTIGGAEMLVWQGAAALEKWTGQNAPAAAMREALLKALESREN